MLRTNQNFFLLLITSGFHQCQSLINSRHLNRPSGNVWEGGLVSQGGEGALGVRGSWLQSCLARPRLAGN